MEQLPVSRGLAVLLDRHADVIGAQWARTLRGLRGSRYAAFTPDELAVWTGRGLAAVIESLHTGSPQPLQAHIRRLVAVRRRLGFGLREVVDALLRLKDAASPFIFEAHASSPRSAREMIEDLDACIRFLVAHFGSLYASAMRDAVEGQRRRASRLLEAIEDAAGTPDTTGVLKRLAVHVRGALDASYCCAYLRDEPGGDLRHRASAGTPDRPELLELLLASVPRKLHRVVRRQPMICSGAYPCPFLRGRTCDEVGIAAVVSLPILVRDELLAVVLAVVPAGRRPERSRVELAMGIANAVAPVIENARLYEESRRNLSESRTIQEISAALLQKNALAGMFELICAESRRVTGAGGAQILLREEGEHLRTAVSHGDTVRDPGSILREMPPESRGEPPVEPLFFADVAHGRDARESAGPDTLMAMPLRLDGETVGYLQLVDVRRKLGEDDLRLIGRIADLATIAIEHTRLQAQHERMVVLEERQKVARDLHDSVTQSIYGVTMLAEAAARKLETADVTKARAHLRELRDVALQALWEMRLMIFELQPFDLKSEGLEAALQARLSTVESRAGLKARFECADVSDLPHSMAESLYRIAQEALNNAIRHAESSTVSLRLTREGGSVRLEFADDGIGFDLAQGRRKGGLGLKGMEERVANAGGTLSIETRPGAGTRIVVELPLDAEPETARPDDRVAEVTG